MKKKVAAIAWIPLQIMAYCIVNSLYSQMVNYINLYSIRYGSPECGTFKHIYYTLHSEFLIPIFLFAIIGWIIIICIKFDDRKIWRSFLFLYMGCHIACLVIVLIFPPLWCDAISSSIFPIISIGGLMIMNAVVRSINKLIFRIKEKNARDSHVV